jgi:hypothetical protein
LKINIVANTRKLFINVNCSRSNVRKSIKQNEAGLILKTGSAYFAQAVLDRRAKVIVGYSDDRSDGAYCAEFTHVSSGKARNTRFS